eukprot:4940260-Amphidinium_carterae.4
MINRPSESIGQSKKSMHWPLANVNCGTPDFDQEISPPEVLGETCNPSMLQLCSPIRHAGRDSDCNREQYHILVSWDGSRLVISSTSQTGRALRCTESYSCAWG